MFATLAVASLASSAAADQLLLRWSQEWLRGDDSGPTITISEKGRVKVHRPAFFKDPGDFELTLLPSELTQLSLDLALLAGFDTEASRQAVVSKRREQQAHDNVTPSLVGAAESTFVLFTTRGEKVIQWRAAAFDADQLADDGSPEGSDLRRLARLEAQLLNLLANDRRQPTSQP